MLNPAELKSTSLTLGRIMIVAAAAAAPISVDLTSIALAAMPIFWLCSGEVYASLKRSWQNAVGKIILVFYAWLMFGACYADTDLSAKIAVLLSWQKLLFVFLLLGFFYDVQWQKRLVHAYLGVMFCAGVACLALWLTGTAFSQQPPGVLMSSPASQTMAFIAAFLCCLFLARHPPNPKFQAYIWAAGGLFLFNIFFIGPARNAFMALPPAVFITGVALYGHRKLPHILVALFGIVAVAVLSSNNLQHRIKQTFGETDDYRSGANGVMADNYRIFYKHTLELIKEKPILGYGTSSFANPQDSTAAAPNNEYLHLWLENGAIGLLLFLAYIFLALRQGFRNRPYGPIAAGFLLSICASSLFSSDFESFAEGNLLALFLGALLAFPPGGQNRIGEHA